MYFCGMSREMETLIIIPARLESERLERKLLLPIGEQSVLEHVCSRVGRCSDWATWLVATDSTEIHDHIAQQSWPVRMTSDQHTCGTERCAEIVQSMDDVTTVVNVQGDEPFVSSDDIRALVDAIETGARIATLYTDLRASDRDDRATVKVFVDESGTAVDFRRAIDSEDICYQHIGLYAFSRDVLLEMVQLDKSPLERERRLEQMRWMEEGVPIKAVYTEHEYIGIDTAEDLERARLHHLSLVS